MSVEMVTFSHRWFDEVWNKGRESAIDEMLAPDAVLHGLAEGGAGLRGPEGFKPFFRSIRAAFPDIEIQVEDVVSEGDLLAIRYSATMTHAGPGFGEPTNRKLAVTGMSFSRMRDGQIVEGWNNWDQLSLLQQMGAVPVAR